MNKYDIIIKLYTLKYVLQKFIQNTEFIIPWVLGVQNCKFFSKGKLFMSLVDMSLHCASVFI